MKLGFVGLAAAAIAGCYAPSFQAGSACDTACPGNLECIDHVCREPGYVPPIDGAIDAVPDAPPVDTDGDMHLDPDDNCPTQPNTDQHDEDGDGLGDVCDPCPHLAGDAADGDSDGVGDLCDPQPAIAKQSIKLFDGFDTLGSQWSLTSGWTQMADQLRLTGASGAATLSIPTGELRIVIGGSVQQIGATPRQLSLEFGYESTYMDYYYGVFYEDGAPTVMNVSRADSGTYTSLAGTTVPGTFPTGPFFMQIDESVSTQKLAMSATIGGSAIASPLLDAGTPALITNNEIVIFGRNAAFRIDYMLVIETAP